MTSTSNGNEPEEVEVHRLGLEGSELAVFEFQGGLRDTIVSDFKKGYLTNGSYVADAKAVSPQGAQSLALAGTAGGATALSAAFSSSLYMATADPTTLMQMGGGVGSAVMGVNGISAQAPFIPIASSLPIVAPVLAMQALNSAVMMQQFKQVDQKLDSIKSTLDKVLARIEATHVGELLAASTIIDQLYRQYELEGSFSTDMMTRLALAERDVSALTIRFRHLVDAQDITTLGEPQEVQQANYDAHSAMLASFTDLRIAYLRLCVDIQENPRSVELSLEQLKSKIEHSSEFWERLFHRSKILKGEISALETKLQDMNWAERNFPTLIGGKGASKEKELQQLNEAYTSTMESEREIMNDFHSLIEASQTTLEALESSAAPAGPTPTLVYWKDEAGEEHSFVTEKLRLA